MLLLPISHEDLTARRWPVVTGAIVAICVVALIVFQFAMSHHEKRLDTAVTAAKSYLTEHPYLSPKPPLSAEDRAPPSPFNAHSRRTPGRNTADPYADSPEGDFLGEIFGKRSPVPPEQLEAEQAELDALGAEVADVLEASPLRRFGYVPKKNNVVGLLASLFLHGGWLHLLGNMWFLWLCGCNLEDRWGRAVFPGFYVVAGIVAALVHKAFNWHSDIPLVGASGAIAGAMGAFLVVYARSRITFFYLWWLGFLPRHGTFQAPAYLMLLLWFVSQLFWALLPIADGVAYLAHVGGFVFGVAFAFALRKTGLERQLDDAVEKTVSVTQDERIVRAGELIDQGNPAGALLVLDAMALQQPNNSDVQLEVLRAAKAARNHLREADAYTRLLRIYINEKNPKAVLDLAAEAQQAGLLKRFPAVLVVDVAEVLAEHGETQRAGSLLAGVLADGITNPHGVRAALLRARLAVRLRRPDAARDLLRQARQSPHASHELIAEIDEELGKLGGSSRPPRGTTT